MFKGRDYYGRCCLLIIIIKGHYPFHFQRYALETQAIHTQSNNPIDIDDKNFIGCIISFLLNSVSEIKLFEQQFDSLNISLQKLINNVYIYFK